MRELPLSVWNERRRVVISPMLLGSATKACVAARPVAVTSRASSKKISSNSGSTSSASTTTGKAGGVAEGAEAREAPAASPGMTSALATEAVSVAA